MRYGFAPATTERLTRASLRMSLDFHEQSVLQTTTCSPSSPTQTTQLRGLPSRRRVARWA